MKKVNMEPKIAFVVILLVCLYVLAETRSTSRSSSSSSSTSRIKKIFSCGNFNIFRKKRDCKRCCPSHCQKVRIRGLKLYECTAGCSPLLEPANGDVNVYGNLVCRLGNYFHAIGSVATYTCDRGFELSNPGTANRVCQNSDSYTGWSGSASTCVPVSCGNPDAPANGSVYFDYNTFEGEASYFCPESFALEGRKYRTCLSTGEWSGDMPSCTFIGPPQMTIDYQFISDQLSNIQDTLDTLDALDLESIAGQISTLQESLETLDFQSISDQLSNIVDMEAIADKLASLRNALETADLQSISDQLANIQNAVNPDLIADQLADLQDTLADFLG